MGEVEHVTVVGAGGTMGSGITAVVAGSGFRVAMVDVDGPSLERGLARVRSVYARRLERGLVTQDDAEAALARITTSTDLEACAATTDHVIETVVEDLEAKRAVLARLDAACRADVVLATNTSQFSITLLAGATARPDRVIGSHWFNPPPAMGLIELVRGLETSDETLALATALAHRYGKQTIVCKKDSQGFITSRLIALLVLEAARIVDEGVADVEDVNKACVLAFNHALGPLDTADLSGLDTLLRVTDSLAEQFGDRFLAPQNVRTLVSAGHVGKKAGRGFAVYDTDG